MTPPRPYQLRTNPDAQKAMDGIRRLEDAYQAITAILQQEGKTNQEIYDAVRYDPNTGRPSEYEWKPHAQFKAEAFIQEQDCIPRVTFELSDIVKGALESAGIWERPLLFSTPDATYTLSYETENHSGMDRSDYAYSRATYLKIKPLTAQITVNGIETGRRIRVPAESQDQHERRLRPYDPNDSKW